MRTRLARFAWAVLGWNVAVILWGAYVRATGGQGCLDGVGHEPVTARRPWKPG